MLYYTAPALDCSGKAKRGRSGLQKPAQPNWSSTRKFIIYPYLAIFNRYVYDKHNSSYIYIYIYIYMVLEPREEVRVGVVGEPPPLVVLGQQAAVPQAQGVLMYMYVCVYIYIYIYVSLLRLSFIR